MTLRRSMEDTDTEERNIALARAARDGAQLVLALREIGWPGFFAMGVFLLEFLVGFVYIWKKGALDWE